MTYAGKGLVLSGLVFPGLGQVILKRYVRGVLMMLAIAAGLIFMTAEAARTALDALARMSARGGTVDVARIVDAAGQAVSRSHTWIYAFSLLLILAVWLFSTVDAYRIGQSLDRSVPDRPRPSVRP